MINEGILVPFHYYGLYDETDYLKNQEIRVSIFVNIFNEDVNIAALDKVMFLHPTKSPIVFLQQLRRGLRRCY